MRDATLTLGRDANRSPAPNEATPTAADRAMQPDVADELERSRDATAQAAAVRTTRADPAP
jgi:hypothetical protein